MGGIPRIAGTNADGTTNWFALVGNEIKNNIVWNTEGWYDLMAWTNGPSYWLIDWRGTNLGVVICSNNVCDCNCYNSTNRIVCPVCGTSTWAATLSLDPDGWWFGPDSTNWNTCTNLPSWMAMTGYDSNSLSCDPRFVNAAAGDYRLSPSSPLIDKGQTLPIVPFDNQGLPRPLGAGYDIGADER